MSLITETTRTTSKQRFRPPQRTKTFALHITKQVCNSNNFFENMALESEPQIAAVPASAAASNKPPKVVFPKDTQPAKNTRSSDTNKKAHKDKSARKKPSKRDIGARKARTSITLSATRKKLPLQRSKRIRVEDSDTDEVENELDPTLDTQGLPARQLALDLANLDPDNETFEPILDEQEYDVKSDEHYPLARPTPKAVEDHRRRL